MAIKRPLREQFRHVLQEDELSDNDIAEIDRLIAQADTRQIRSQRPYWRLLAAAMMAFMMLGYIGWKVMPESVDTPVVSQRIAEEVLTNHVHIRAMDTETSSFDQVRRSLDRLDFVPVASSVVENTGLRLLGARYCTLQGTIATQLLFETEQGDIVTFYQAAYDPERFGPMPHIDRQQQPMVLLQQGVEILLWVERGVLIAQARQRPGISAS